MSEIILGNLDEGVPGSTGPALRVDIPTLVDSRALITGNSGAGKSRLLRRLAEQAFGKVQQIIIDPEGEFATLREKHDFLLAGKGGEVPAEPRAAALLARRLMELRASAILDLYDLKLDEQRAFVKVFVESLLELPRDQYRPVLILIDEAHRFAPEDGDSQSRDAVVSLMSQGRKRGLCGIPATQRLSKLVKDAASEAANGFIGRTTLDVDQKRAADALGFSSKDERVALRDLDNGVFYAYGPAINRKGVVLFKGGDVQTTHPKAGQRHKVEAPAPPDAIRNLADELKDLPAQAAEEIRTLQAAKVKVRELERDLREAKKAQPPPPTPKAPRVVEKPVLKDAQVKRLEAVVVKIDDLVGRAQFLVGEATNHKNEIKAALAAARDAQGNARGAVAGPALMPAAVGAGRPAVPSRPAPVVPRTPRAEGDGRLERAAERKVLSVLAQYPEGRTAKQVAVLAGYALNGGGFNNALGRLRSLGYIVGSGAGLRITTAGQEAVGGVDPLPTGRALQEHWLRHLDRAAERAALQALIGAHPNAMTREEVALIAGYEPNGGGFNNALGKLRTLELISGRGELRAADELFE